MTNFISGLISRRVASQVVQVNGFRYWEKKPYIRRYGYEDPVLLRGTLPRIDDFPKVTPFPEYRPKNSWSDKKALLGQNDYIDILGDGNLHPLHLLTEVPLWLRGVSGNEYKILIRKKKFFGELFSIMKPTSFEKLEKRMDHLYRYLNRKTKSSR